MLKIRDTQPFILSVLLALLAPAALHADVQQKPYAVDELTTMSDAIVIGQVKNKESKFADGVIQTKYTLAVSQSLKGKVSPTMEITQVGGSVEGLPFKQRLSGRPTLFKGEKVLLFLSDSSKSPAMQAIRQKSKENQAKMQAQALDQGKPIPQIRSIPDDHPLKTSMGFVAGWQGRFTIITDKATGREMAMQVGPGDGRDIQSEDALKAFCAVMEKKAPAAPTLSPGGGALPPSKAAASAADADEAMLESFLTTVNDKQMQPLDVLKDQVRLQLAQEAAKANK